MSLINDALKQARQAPPRNLPNAAPPLQPAQRDSSSTAIWLVPAVIIFLVFAAIFFIGWAAAHRTVHDSFVSAPIDPETTQQVATVTAPVVVVETPPPPPPPDLPKLQGIFYSSQPSAILDGKTIHNGDLFKGYKVKEISKYTVTLTGPDKKDVKIGLGD